MRRMSGSSFARSKRCQGISSSVHEPMPPPAGNPQNHAFIHRRALKRAVGVVALATEWLDELFLRSIFMKRELASGPGPGGIRMAGAVAKIIEDLRNRGGLKGTDVANIASVSPATVSRWTAGKAFPQPKTQLVISDLRYVVDRLAEFYSPDETRIWLYSKHPLVNGERAIDLIHAGRTDEVLAVIESLDQSTYT